MLDLSLLASSKKKICVRCTDEDAAKRFVSEMKKQYPEKCTHWYAGETHWRDQDFVDYFPYLNNIDGSPLLWDDEGYAEKNEYLIVDFYDLSDSDRITDFGDITASEFALDTLFN